MTGPSVLPPVVELSRLGALTGAPAFTGGGQCRGVWRVPECSGALFKWYDDQTAADAGDDRLDALIAERTRLTVAERRLVHRHTAWPVSRVTDGGRTVGVVLPAAPEGLSYTWYSPRARRRHGRHEPLIVDYLAKPNSYLQQRGIPAQSAADRLAVCAALSGVAALLERRGLVYADWSYTNAFWHPVTHLAYVIDLDGCSYGPRGHVLTPNFEDPLTAPPADVDGYVDRYRAALLIARCLTAVRDPAAVAHLLGAMGGGLPATLLRMLLAGDRTQRPSLGDLARAVAGEVVAAARPGVLVRPAAPVLPAPPPLPPRPPPPRPPVPVLSPRSTPHDSMLSAGPVIVMCAFAAIVLLMLILLYAALLTR